MPLMPPRPVHLRSNRGAGVRRTWHIAATIGGVILALALPTQAHAADFSGHSSTGTVASTVTVQRGDSLSRLAARLCGNANRWPQIYRANPAVKDADLIFVGQRLVVPCATGGRGDSRASRSATTRTNSSNQRSVPTASTAGSWVHPLPGSRLTDCWGAGRNHKGIDLARPTGTPIRAAAAGTVTQAGWIWSGYGISVVVRHSNGAYTHYAHMSRDIVAVGATVRAGQTIGYVGTTGQVTGPHLHFEIGLGGVLGHQVNPAPYLRARGVAIGC